MTTTVYVGGEANLGYIVEDPRGKRALVAAYAERLDALSARVRSYGLSVEVVPDGSINGGCYAAEAPLMGLLAIQGEAWRLEVRVTSLEVAAYMKSAYPFYAHLRLEKGYPPSLSYVEWEGGGYVRMVNMSLDTLIEEAGRRSERGY